MTMLSGVMLCFHNCFWTHAIMPVYMSTTYDRFLAQQSYSTGDVPDLSKSQVHKLVTRSKRNQYTCVNESSDETNNVNHEKKD